MSPYIAMHLSIQHENTVQMWTTAVHSIWLSRHNHEANRDKGMLDMNITINDIGSHMDMSIRSTTTDDEHLTMP